MAAQQDETRRLLAYICARMGGPEKVAQRLGVNPSLLSSYLTSKELIPDVLVLRLVDLVLEDVDALKNNPAAPPPSSQPASRAPDPKSDR